MHLGVQSERSQYPHHGEGEVERLELLELNVVERVVEVNEGLHEEAEDGLVNAIVEHLGVELLHQVGSDRRHEDVFLEQDFLADDEVLFYHYALGLFIIF